MVIDIEILSMSSRDSFAFYIFPEKKIVGHLFGVN